MAFSRRLLGEGEEIVFDLRPHWWYFAKPGGAGVGVLVFLVAVFQVRGDLRSVGLWLFAAGAMAWAVWLIVVLVRWANTHVVITTQRLVSRTGVLSRRGREVPLSRIVDLSFSQSLWGRIAGVGELWAEAAGEGGTQRFQHIPHPEVVQHEIQNLLEAGQETGWETEATTATVTDDRPDADEPSAPPASPATSSPASGSEASIPEQIRQLARLRDEGVVTEEEFERKKTELLDRM